MYCIEQATSKWTEKTTQQTADQKQVVHEKCYAATDSNDSFNSIHTNIIKLNLEWHLPPRKLLTFFISSSLFVDNSFFFFFNFSRLFNFFPLFHNQLAIKMECNILISVEQWRPTDKILLQKRKTLAKYLNTLNLVTRQQENGFHDQH